MYGFQPMGSQMFNPAATANNLMSMPAEHQNAVIQQILWQNQLLMQQQILLQQQLAV